jgi:aryl-phospho-beta-D-glucosidase BglC (GH1 family)
MKHKRFFNLVIIVVFVAALAPFVSRSALAQTTLPTASTVASQIGAGWNLGNTLEATPCGETAWGNPMVTQAFIDSVKAAGFNSIRIPVAWDCHATNGTIDPAWMTRVKQVVDYAINDGMYVIINIHWDGGWLENHVTYADQTAVNAKQKNYWTQIANAFISYDQHLIFAGTNETHQDYAEPTAEYIAVQQSYLQTFVNAVRATGGNNASRTLAVQTYNTNMWYGLRYFTMPTDTIANRLMVEVHYYDPYDYTLNTSGPCLAWGAQFTQYSQCAWAQEAYVDDLFNQVRNKWVNAGVPVFIGEYGVARRSGLDNNSRLYWLKYITASAVANGMKTFYWDNGATDMGIFNRTTGAITDQAAVTALIQASVPCSACTGTPTKTPTRTATITMTPCYGCGFKLQYKTGDVSASPNQLTPQFNIINNSAAAVPMSEFTIRYWYTNEGNQAQTYACDYATAGCANSAATFVKMVYPKTGADAYVEVGFSAAAGSLAAGGQSSIQARINKADWSAYTQTNDYSFDATKTAYADWDHVTLYHNGDLVWGVEPGQGATPTPGASLTPSSTPSRTLTPTLTLVGATSTATRTLTATNTSAVTPTRTLTPALTATRTPTPEGTPTAGLTATRTPTPVNTSTRTPGTPTTGPTSTRTLTPGITPTTSVGACSPVTSTITSPFTFDGAGTFCWQASTLGTYINSWNTTSVSVNGTSYNNVYTTVASLPAKINGFWYISYNSAVAWGHFEAK